MGSKKVLEYFNGDELATKVWIEKYALEGEETPDDMHRRMAKEFARIEEKYIPLEKIELPNKLSDYGKTRGYLSENRIYELFKDFKYIVPQGSIMSQLGAESIGSLSNCFVIGQPEDSYGGIFQKDEEMVQLMKRRGGVGIDISTLRPAETTVSNAAKTTTGAVSFMHRFSNSTREVAQNGRRGALMLSIDINHPDVLDFIQIKRDLTQVTGANISVKINNDFMKAVEADEDYILRFPCDLDKIPSDTWLEKTEYNELLWHETIKDKKQVYYKKIRAREYWDEIIKSAHGYAEPGIIFVDNHHNYSPDGVYPQFKGVTTNPCGEIFMQPYDACRLIAVNLFSFVKNPFTKDAEFDIKKFYEVNYEAMRLSDDLIDLEIEHIDRILNKLLQDPQHKDVKMREISLWEKVRETAQASRRTGLGFTALGDCLAALGLGYDSEEGLLFIEQFMHVKMESELDCTIDLAQLRDPFEGWDMHQEFEVIGDEGYPNMGTNSFYDFIYSNFPEQAKKMARYGRRNVSWNTVAPTGTVSLLTQTTSGLEPLFMPFYMRRKKVNQGDGVKVDFTDQNGDTWQEFPVLHEKFKQWINHTYGAPIIDKEGKGMGKEELQEWFEKSPWFGSTANDIDWVKRVEVQGIIQKYITHSISSTINLPSTVTTDQVSEIYLEAWKKGLKGITVYVDGSRSGVLVSSSENKSREDFDYVDAVKRPKELEAESHLTRVGGVPHYVIVGLFNDKPYEVFIENHEIPIGKGKLIKQSRGNYKFVVDEYEQLVTGAMSDEQAAITRLTSTSLRHGADIKFLVEQLQKTPGDMFSFTKGLARVLKKYIPDGAKSTVTCLDCGGTNVIFEEGCNKCKDCGSSKCG